MSRSKAREHALKVLYAKEINPNTAELSADIFRRGIYLTGGASQVNHLAELLAKGTGLKVNVSENPVSGVALGLAKIIKDDNYKSVAYLEGMSR